MALTRVLIETDNDPPVKIQANANTRVFFNPNAYQLQRRVEWKETKSNGMDLPGLQFVSGGPRSLALSLVVRHLRQRRGCPHADRPDRQTRGGGRQATAPTLLHDHLGARGSGGPAFGLPFRGVVESLTQKFTLFLDDGTPVRATVDVGFKEGQSVQKQLKRNPRARSSPLQPRTRIVRDGDTLWSIAAAVYGDPAKWRALARANALVNPRILAPGTELLVPSEE